MMPSFPFSIALLVSLGAFAQAAVVQAGQAGPQGRPRGVRLHLGGARGPAAGAANPAAAPFPGGAGNGTGAWDRPAKEPAVPGQAAPGAGEALATQPPSAPVVPLILPPLAVLDQAPPGAPRFNVEVRGQALDDFLKRFSREAGFKVELVGPGSVPVTFKVNAGTVGETLQAMARSVGLEVRQGPEATFLIGFPGEFILANASPDDPTIVETVFQCRHLGADSLAQTLAGAFPELKILAGPAFLTPSLDAPGAAASFNQPSQAMNSMAPYGMSGSQPTSDPDSPNPLSATDVTFKRHDLTVKGPAGQVRRALVLARRMDRARQQVRINVKLSNVSTSFARDLGINWDFGVNGSQTTFGELANSDLAPYSGNNRLQFGSFAHSPVSVNLQLRAGEDQGAVHTLANPSMLVLDGERCFILLGDKYLYPKQTGQTAQGQPNYDVAELKTGVYLQMAVQIGLDGDLILTAYPQDSYVSDYKTYNGNQYPVVTTREAQTTVRLRSGEMLVIGGLRQESVSWRHTRVPLLGAIPGLGVLFGNKNRSNSNSELLLLIQPEILNPLEDAVTRITPARPEPPGVRGPS